MNGKVSRRVLARTIAQKLLSEPGRRQHWLRVTAAYLVENSMDNMADLVMNDISRELFKQSGHLIVDVTSARKLTDETRAELTRTLKESTNAKRVEIAEKVDPELLGGLVARTPDAILDTSVRTKLKQLASLT